MDELQAKVQLKRRIPLRSILFLAAIVIIAVALVVFRYLGNISRETLESHDLVQEAMEAVYIIWEDRRLEHDRERSASYQDLQGALPTEGIEIAAPYAVFSATLGREKNRYLLRYSEGVIFDESAPGGLKTILYAHPSFEAQAVYQKVNSSGTNMGSTGVETYSIELYVYDVETGTLTGLMTLPAPVLSEKLSGSSAYLRPSDKEVLALVDTMGLR